MFTILFNNLEAIIISIIISILSILIYDFIKKSKKTFVNIVKFKVNIQNKYSWSKNTSDITDDTKGIELSFILEIFNPNNYYNSIYRINVFKKIKNKYYAIEYPYLFLSDTFKSISGSTTYEKFKFINLLPHEYKEFNIRIKLTKEEFENIKKEPISIVYLENKKTRKIKINKYLNRKKK